MLKNRPRYLLEIKIYKNGKASSSYNKIRDAFLQSRNLIANGYNLADDYLFNIFIRYKDTIGDNKENLSNLEILRLLCIYQTDGDLGGKDLIKRDIKKGIGPDRIIRKHLAENDGIL